jgi:O-acetyl-ADP-ribose deacetylase
VNAANSELAPGGGVDGAIRRAGGPDITAGTRSLGRCPTGEARATTAGRLAARHVVHAVGPIWRGGGEREEELLAACHRSALELAAALGCRSISFPAISTGIYGYPPELAAPVALGAVAEALERHPAVERARFVLFAESARDIYAAALAALRRA